mgnify:CR=1 FL=1
MEAELASLDDHSVDTVVHRIDEIVSRLQEIDDRLKEIHSSTSEHRAHAILEGLQFTEERMHMTTRQLSGRGEEE